MIDLCAAGTANGMRARIGLEECGLAYDFHPIADFALYGVVARVKGTQPALVEGFANVTRWADEMAARPAIQRAMKF